MLRAYAALLARQDRPGTPAIPEELVRLAIRVLLDKTERLVLRALREIRESPERRGLLEMPGLQEYLAQQVLQELLAKQVILVIPAPRATPAILD